MDHPGLPERTRFKQHQKELEGFKNGFSYKEQREDNLLLPFLPAS